MAGTNGRPTAWEAADGKIARAASESASRWLPPCTDADIRRVWLLLLGELIDGELADISPGRIAKMISRLELEIGRERGRSKSGHRNYDVNRHIALCQVMQALRARLATSCNRALPNPERQQQ
jgi:hypothetical protein